MLKNLSITAFLLLGFAILGTTLFAWYEVEFPDCKDLLNVSGDHAHYDYGIHQIAGGERMEGRDDVFKLPDSRYLQCFCGLDGQGIQTNWIPSDVGEWGPDWNLDQIWYSYENSEYDCKPRPIPTPVPTPTPFSESEPASPPECVGQPVTKQPRIWHVERIDSDTVNVYWESYDGHTQSFVVYYGLVGQQPLPWNSVVHKDDRQISLNELPPNQYIDVQVCSTGACGDQVCSEIVDP